MGKAYRADHVGSLLRPPELLQAGAAYLLGRATAEAGAGRRHGPEGLGLVIKENRHEAEHRTHPYHPCGQPGTAA